jgi:hypothetical protein
MISSAASQGLTTCSRELHLKELNQERYVCSHVSLCKLVVAPEARRNFDRMGWKPYVISPTIARHRYGQSVQMYQPSMVLKSYSHIARPGSWSTGSPEEHIRGIACVGVFHDQPAAKGSRVAASPSDRMRLDVLRCLPQPPPIMTR